MDYNKHWQSFFLVANPFCELRKEISEVSKSNHILSVIHSARIMAHV